MRPKPLLAALAALAVLGACAGNAAPSADPSPATGPAPTGPPATSAAAPTTVAESVPQGFDRVAARVTAADGEVCELCVWVADDADLRARGLMHVTDLGDADAMAFVYPAPTTSSFWMKDTLLPLSIAFFDGDGAFLDSFDMEPCTTRICTSYPTAPGFTVAVEAPRGTLADLLMLPGSTLTLGELPCDE